MPDANSPSPTLSALQGLVLWSTDRPQWQRDALRRLYKNGTLTEQDCAELYELLKQEFSLVEVTEENAVQAQPLSVDHIPNFDGNSGAVKLVALKSVKDVNALAEGQSLNFHSDGMTVIFGNNGSGKSGYARILKDACRARSTETILHNVYGDTPEEPASADITASVNGVERTIQWKNGEVTNEVLSAVSVFDAKCASSHVDDKNEAAFIPLPLTIIRGLSELCIDFKARLKRSHLLIEDQLPQGLRELTCGDETEAGKLLLSLSMDTDLEAATALGTLSDDDQLRLETLEESLKQDPQVLIANERVKLAQVESVTQRLKQVFTSVSDEAVEAVAKKFQDATAKSGAARIAADRAFKDDSLSGIGESAWIALWNAAKEYSKDSAYPENEFPNTEDAVCVLCQQPIDEAAGKRLGRFEEFVRENSQKAAAEAIQAFKTHQKKLKGAKPQESFVAQDESLASDQLQRSDIQIQIRRFYRVAAVRIERICRLQVGDDWKALREIGRTPIENLELIAKESKEKIQLLVDSIDPEVKAKNVAEMKELVDRKLLGTKLEDVEVEIERQLQLQRTAKALRSTETQSITRQATTLADSLITNTWRDRFADEISRLEMHHLRVELQKRGGAVGAAKYRIAFVRATDVSLGSVLSEGEHRCIALAAFLAELSTTSGLSTIVFDDPVSSLDHEHREVVAKRLAEECAAGRQVLVFTHDVLFLELLSRRTREQSVRAKFLTVNRTPDSRKSGLIELGTPTSVAPAREIADQLRRQVSQLQQAYDNGQIVAWEQRTHGFSLQLRKCWERAVAELVAPVIKRFEVQVNSKNIWQLTAIEQSDCITMREAYSRASELSHEKCAELSRAAPTPQNFYDEIQAVCDWIDLVRGKQTAAQEARPA